MILFAIFLFILIAFIWIAIIVTSLLVTVASIIGIAILAVLCAIGMYVLIVGLSIEYLTDNRQKGDLV
jgi:hypothetical protein